jgi:hypothetical protein
LPKQEIGPASSWNKEKNGTSLNITADNHQKEYAESISIESSLGKKNWMFPLVN